MTKRQRARNIILRFFQDVWSLVVGLWITAKFAAKRPVTLEYPAKKRELPKGVKGPVRFVYFPESQSHNCIACSMCERTCPSKCIKVKGSKMAELKRRPHYFTLDYSTCSLCSLCIEVCPTKTLEHSYNIEWVAETKEAFVVDLIKKTADYQLSLGGHPTGPLRSQENPYTLTPMEPEKK